MKKLIIRITSHFEKSLSENQTHVQLIEKTDIIDAHREMIDERKGIWKTHVSDTGDRQEFTRSMIT